MDGDDLKLAEDVYGHAKENSTLTDAMKERMNQEKDDIKQREEEERQTRREEFFKTNENANEADFDAHISNTKMAGPGQGRGKSSIVNRYEIARRIQQKQEEDRLMKLKFRGGADTDRKGEISNLVKTFGTGFVKRRVMEQEELFMQNLASPDQLAEMVNTTMEKSQDSNAIIFNQMIGPLERKRFEESANVSEKVKIGETHIYNAKLLGSHIFSYLKKTMSDTKSSSFTLSCGVYGEQSKRPPIEVFAAAVKTDERPSVYIALMIKKAAGHDDDTMVFAARKIAIFDKHADQNIFERLIDVVPEMDVELIKVMGASNDSMLSMGNNPMGGMSNNPMAGMSRRMLRQKSEKHAEPEPAPALLEAEEDEADEKTVDSAADVKHSEEVATPEEQLEAKLVEQSKGLESTHSTSMYRIFGVNSSDDELDDNTTRSAEKNALPALPPLSLSAIKMRQKQQQLSASKLKRSSDAPEQQGAGPKDLGLTTTSAAIAALRVEEEVEMTPSQDEAAALEEEIAQETEELDRYLSTVGINCNFFLPVKDGKTKAIRATIRCPRNSVAFSVEVVKSSHESKRKVKVLTFDVAEEILSVEKGRGSVVRIPSSVQEEDLLHIVLKDKPEINLGFEGIFSRDSLFAGLPRIFADRRVSKSVEEVVEKSVLNKFLAPENRNKIRLNYATWVQIKVKSLLGKKYANRLLIAKSNQSFDLYTPPSQYASTATSLAAAALGGDVEDVRSELITQLMGMDEEVWSAAFLTEKGFQLDTSVSFYDIQHVVHAGAKVGFENVVYINTHNSSLKIKLETPENREVLVQLIENKQRFLNLV